MLAIILGLIFAIIVSYIAYKIIETYGFKGVFIYNLIVNIISVIIEIYANLNISIIIVSLIIIILSSLINAFIQFWSYRVSSSFIGYLLITILVGGIISSLVEAFIEPLLVKFIVWVLNIFGIIS